MGKINFENKFGGGSKLLINSFRFIVKKPIFLLPIFLVWIISTVGTLYFRYWWQPPEEISLLFLTIFLFILVLCYFINLAGILMLEFIRQIESVEKISLKKATKETLKNSGKVLFLSFIWASVWFIFLLIEAIIEILDSKRRKSEKSKPSLKDAAQTLAGINSPFSWIGLGLSLLRKLIRMILFLSLPAIVWEKKGAISSLKKSFQIIKTHSFYFFSTCSLTLTVVIMIILPLSFIFVLDERGVLIPNLLWTIIIIYIGIIWSLQIYLEQMMTGMLYLWHLKWEKSGRKDSLLSVPKPNLLDDFQEFKEIEKMPQKPQKSSR